MRKNHLEMLLKAVSKNVRKAYRKTYNLNLFSKDRPSFLHLQSLGNAQSIFISMLESKNILLNKQLEAAWS